MEGVGSIIIIEQHFEIVMSPSCDQPWLRKQIPTNSGQHDIHNVIKNIPMGSLNIIHNFA